MGLKRSKLFGKLGVLLIIGCVSSNVYAKDVSLESKKTNIIQQVNSIANILEVEPQVVMAVYIEQGGAVLDSELDFKANDLIIDKNSLTDEVIKLYNAQTSDPRFNLIKDEDVDDMKFIMYNKKMLEKESLDIYNGWKGDKPSVHIQLKESYLNLGYATYNDWSKYIVDNTNNNTNINSNSNSISNETVKFNWVMNRERLGSTPLRITSQYAYRSSGEMHRALDFATKEFIGENGNVGELNLYPVHANSKIIKIVDNPNTSTGLAVWYEFTDEEGDTYSISYMHMSSLNSNIKVGSIVGADTYLGTTGNTGDATGIHIHIQADKNGKRINPLRLWGYDPTATESVRRSWAKDNNLDIPCMGECTQILNYTSSDIEFSIIKCEEHNNLSY